MSDHGPRRSRGRHRRRRPASDPVEFPLCPVCEKAVRELASAITHRETGLPAHFDCVLRILREENTLSDNEKICYLGKGSFGIVQFRPNGAPPRFLVRQRIQYEDLETVPDWRKTTARRLSAQ